MSESNTHIDLFTKSGCLTKEALKRHNDDALSDMEKDQVQGHLDSCELCSDALEGLQLMTDPGKLNSIVSEINDNLKVRHSESVEIDKIKKLKSQSRLYYFAAAASILILIGVFSYFRFYYQNQNSEISVLSEKPKNELVEDIKFTTEESIEDEVSQQVVKESKPISPVDMVQDKTDKPVEKIDEISIAEVEPEQEIAIESISVEDSEEETIVDPLNEVVMGKSNTIGISEKQTQNVVDGISISEYVLDSGGNTSEDKITSEEVQNSSTQARMQPTMAKKGRSALSTESKSTINPESLSDSTLNVFTVVDTQPEYPGGMEALDKHLLENISYPDSAKNLGIQGTVFVSFIVKKSGKVDNAKVVRGIGGGCDEEALRIVKSMPEWIPGEQRGKPVNTEIVLPIKFKLD
jgi:TonB family protein